MKNTIWGLPVEKSEILRRVGDVSQIAGARSSRIDNGKGEGVQVVDIKTGTGLNFTVVPSRGMDICWADYKGVALSFVSKTGIVNPGFYETDYDGFHRSFFAGLLTTCGLRNIGAGCFDKDEYLGLHGRINNIPAHDVCISNDWSGNQYVMKVRGKVAENKLYGENLLLTREITAYLGENVIKIHDTVENCGFYPEPLTILYHCNFGYPLLDRNSYLILPEHKVIPRDETAAEQIDNYDKFDLPQNNYPETVFFHKLASKENGWTYAAIFNPDIDKEGLGAAIKYNQKNLPVLVEWKNMGNGDYVAALEPANCYPEGRTAIRNRGMLQYLQPGEIREFDLEFSIINGKGQIAELSR